MSIKNIVIIPIMTTIIVITSWISIPFVIPFTLSIFGISLTLSFIGGKRGIISILLYLILGIIGIPVFAGMEGGIGIILGPTGGFIIGYFFMGLTYLILEKIIKLKFINLLISLIICYLCGVIWYKLIYQSPESIFNIIKLIILPFVLFDILKILLSCFITNKINKIIKININNGE